jgi:hypothetical protein
VFLFGEEITGTKATNRKLSWVRFLTGGSFCRPETNHERTAPRQNLFVEEITGTKVANQKTVLSSSPDKDGFCGSGTKHARRTAQITKLFVSARRLQELRSQIRELSWVRVFVKMGLGIIIFSVILTIRIE